MQATTIISQIPKGQKSLPFGGTRGGIAFGRIKGNLLLTYLLLAGMVVPSFAQKNLLEGSWKLDSVSVVKSSNRSVVEISQVKQNPYFGLFDELIFQGEELTITENGYQVNGLVQISNTKIAFHFTPAPIEAEYEIKNGELFLTQRISYPGEGHPDNERYIVYTKYKKQ